MSEKFAKVILCISVILTITLGIILTVIGGTAEGWPGVGVMLVGQGIFILLLYLYNRKYR